MHCLAPKSWQLIHFFDSSSQGFTIKMHCGWISSLNRRTLNNWLILQNDLATRNYNWLQFTVPAGLTPHKLKIDLVYCSKVRDSWVHLCVGLSHGGRSWLLQLRRSNVWLRAWCPFTFQNLVSWDEAPRGDILRNREWLLMFQSLSL